jgi:hypothetical protein
MIEARSAVFAQSGGGRRSSGFKPVFDISDIICSAPVENEVTMLAYIFWRARYVDVDVLEYVLHDVVGRFRCPQ